MALFRKKNIEDDDDIDMTLDFEEPLINWEERRKNYAGSPHAITADELMSAKSTDVTIPMTSYGNGKISPAAKAIIDRMYENTDDASVKRDNSTNLPKQKEKTTEHTQEASSDKFLRHCFEVMTAQQKDNVSISSEDSIDEIIRSAEERAKSKIAELLNGTDNTSDSRLETHDIIDTVKSGTSVKNMPDSFVKDTGNAETVSEMQIQEQQKEDIQQNSEKTVAERATDEITYKKPEPEEEHKLNVEIIDMDSDDQCIKTVSENKPNVAEGQTVVFGALGEKENNSDDIFSAIRNAAEKAEAADKEYTDIDHTRAVPLGDKNMSALFGDAVRNTDHAESTHSVPLPNNKSEELFDDDDFTEFDQDVTDIDDYNTPSDARELIGTLKSKISRAGTRIILSVITTLLMFAGSISIFSAVPLVGHAVPVILALAMLCNYEIFSGLVSLFKGKPDYNTSTFLICTVIFIHQILQLTVFHAENYVELGALAGLSLVFNAVTCSVKENRILNGLEQISSGNHRYGISLIYKKRDTKVIAGNAVDGEALIVAKQPVTVSLDYMKQSRCKSGFDVSYPLIFSVGFFVSAVIGFSVGTLKNDLSTGLMVFEIASSLFLPLVATLTSELPLKCISDKLYDAGAAIAGHYGADRIAESNAVVLNAGEIFSEGSVTMYNMHILGSSEVEHTILDAAAVVKKVNSPLFGMFKSIIGKNDLKKIPEAEEINYEDKMGVSGWIGQRRILVGNRTLMEGHNIVIPPISVDQKILKAGYFPVYVACDNKACILFSVKYSPDEKIGNMLTRLCNAGMTLLIESGDPNVTESMVADYFDIYDDAVKVLNHDGVACLHKNTEAVKSKSAPACCSKNILGYLGIISSAVRLDKTKKMLNTIYYIGAIIIVAAIMYGIFAGISAIVSSVPVFILSMALGCLVTVIAAIIKP